MEIRINRLINKSGYCVGTLQFGNFKCATLEPTDRKLSNNDSLSDIMYYKVDGKTAIPTGEYEVKMTYSNRFNRMMPEIVNVKGFAGVRIHSGNSASDTAGCILLGDYTGNGYLINSKQLTTTFENLLSKSLKNGKITVQITSNYD